MIGPSQNTLLSSGSLVGIELSEVVHIGHNPIDHDEPWLLLLLWYARSLVGRMGLSLIENGEARSVRAVKRQV